jgi:hypothetical protein
MIFKTLVLLMLIPMVVFTYWFLYIISKELHRIRREGL